MTEGLRKAWRMYAPSPGCAGLILVMAGIFGISGKHLYNDAVRRGPTTTHTKENVPSLGGKDATLKIFRYDGKPSSHELFIQDLGDTTASFMHARDQGADGSWEYISSRYSPNTNDPLPNLTHTQLNDLVEELSQVKPK